MKKFFSFILILTILATCVFTFVACNDELPVDKYEKFKISNAKDYMNLDLNYDAFTCLNAEGKKQGLFLVTGYKTAGEVDKLAKGREIPIEVPADDNAEFIANFDENAPILIIIHGVQIGDGRKSNAYYWAENLDAGIDLSKIFYDESMNVEGKNWNVCYFHYEQFSDAPGTGDYLEAAGEDLGNIVSSCWTKGNDGKGSKIIQMVDEETNTAALSEEAAFDGALSEFFVSEYSRMIAAIKKNFPNYKGDINEIRIAAHSMGGVVTVSSITLIAALVDAGKFDKAFAPDRVALLDPYIGYYGSSDLKISWNGKSIGYWRESYVLGIEYFKKVTGGTIEMYVNDTIGIIPYMVTPNGADNERFEDELKQITAYTVIFTKFTNVTNPTYSNGHNAVREWYFYSYTYGKIPTYNKTDAKIVSGRYTPVSGANTIGYCASASLSIADLKAIVGKPSIQLVGSAKLISPKAIIGENIMQVFIPFDQY